MQFADLKVLDNFKITIMGKDAPILKKMNDSRRIDESNAIVVGSDKWTKIALDEEVEPVP